MVRASRMWNAVRSEMGRGVERRGWRFGAVGWIRCEGVGGCWCVGGAGTGAGTGAGGF